RARRVRHGLALVRPELHGCELARAERGRRHCPDPGGRIRLLDPPAGGTMTETLTPSSAEEPTPTRVPLVEMRDIRVTFGGVRAVAGVSVDLHQGEVVGLVGGNGAGKSTLMKVLSGAQSPDSGEIFVDG